MVAFETRSHERTRAASAIRDATRSEICVDNRSDNRSDARDSCSERRVACSAMRSVCRCNRSLISERE
jgi:hypothetical protein